MQLQKLQNQLVQAPDDYLRAFEGAKNIFLVTITGTLSGSHNSAQLAKNIYLEEHPDTKNSYN